VVQSVGEVVHRGLGREGPVGAEHRVAGLREGEQRGQCRCAGGQRGVEVEVAELTLYQGGVLAGVARDH